MIEPIFAFIPSDLITMVNLLENKKKLWIKNKRVKIQFSMTVSHPSLSITILRVMCSRYFLFVLASHLIIFYFCLFHEIEWRGNTILYLFAYFFFLLFVRSSLIHSFMHFLLLYDCDFRLFQFKKRTHFEYIPYHTPINTHMHTNTNIKVREGLSTTKKPM